MNADELIRALAADTPAQTPSLNRSIARAMMLGIVCALALFLATIGPRHGLASAIHDPRVILKFLTTLSLVIAAGGLLLRTIRPGAGRGWWAIALLCPVLLIALGAIVELSIFPQQMWGARLVGRFAPFCLVCVPLLSAPILAALLYVLRQGAPIRPGLAGAVAGLLAGGAGAFIYAAHCPDDSPLFLMTWYSLSIALVTLAGSLIGRRVLRW
jgi:hypothetical protein